MSAKYAVAGCWFYQELWSHLYGIDSLELGSQCCHRRLSTIDCPLYWTAQLDDLFIDEAEAPLLAWLSYQRVSWNHLYLADRTDSDCQLQQPTALPYLRSLSTRCPKILTFSFAITSTTTDFHNFRQTYTARQVRRKIYNWPTQTALPCKTSSQLSMYFVHCYSDTS